MTLMRVAVKTVAAGGAATASPRSARCLRTCCALRPTSLSAAGAGAGLAAGAAVIGATGALGATPALGALTDPGIAAGAARVALRAATA